MVSAPAVSPRSPGTRERCFSRRSPPPDPSPPRRGPRPTPRRPTDPAPAPIARFPLTSGQESPPDGTSPPGIRGNPMFAKKLSSIFIGKRFQFLTDPLYG